MRRVRRYEIDDFVNGGEGQADDGVGCAVVDSHATGISIYQGGARKGNVGYIAGALVGVRATNPGRSLEYLSGLVRSQ